MCRLFITFRYTYFSLQRRQTSGLTGRLVGTFDSVFDSSSKLFPFRIVYHPQQSDISYLIATGRTLDALKPCWTWLEDNLLETLNEFETADEQNDYVLGKISALLTKTSGAAGSDTPKKSKPSVHSKEFKEAVLKFRQTFAMPAEEKLVNWYSCAIVKNKIPWQGWIYLSQNHCCFYSYVLGKETKLSIRWTDVKDLNRVENIFLPEGIQIDTSVSQGASQAFYSASCFEPILSLF